MFFKLKEFFTVILLVIPISRAYLTQDRPVTMSSLYIRASLLTDGVIDLLGASTQSTPNPWMNIELVQSTTIAVVILLEMYYYDSSHLD